ncbi:nitrite reductase (NAD(P)H) small subunit [Endozoicomonas sp. OPT23]|uniref:nitrite reductase small subunit NirD n=1 Tax=Endozoicomonas sp. OPT23 TaxID=2072845 RepID=UPI00129AF62D|nr:nitrite reductase small subunit NirD [Endozoicomonas sp. OPT23]MRI34653.1 nitrite reductase (NAD(P)H) small subunit [Endozoicomonas sp. OPT23]
MTNTHWNHVAHLDQLLPDLGGCVLVNDHQIALFHLAGKVFALDNYDPFSCANVISRGLTGDLNGRLVVASPVYKQHFDLESGQCLEDENIRLNVYPVSVIDDQVYVCSTVLATEVA